MRILAITYAFAPLRYPATFRLLKWFKYLDEVGHKVTVVSVDPDSFAGAKDNDLGRLVPPNVENITAWSPENNTTYRVLRRWSSLLPWLFQPFKKEWYRPARKALGSLRLDDYDLVFSCSQPPVCHLLGLHVKTVTRLPWVAYLSDPWADRPDHATMPARIRQRNLALEQKVIASADRVVFSSEETKRLVMKKYAPDTAGRAETLDHSFVPEWFGLREAARQESTAGIRIVSTGSFYGPRAVVPFLRLLSEPRTLNCINRRLRFEFYGTMSDEERHDPVWESVGCVAEFRGSLDYLTSLATIRRADALLLIDGPVDDGSVSVFFPSKLAEYLGSGRPIIGFTPAAGTSARVLRQTRNFAVDNRDDEGLRKLLAGFVDGQPFPEPDLALSAKYDYRNVGRQLVEILARALSGNGSCGAQ